MKSVLSGIVPACHTPFHADGRLNLAAVRDQYDLFRECGVKSVFICGTTGEWASLTLDERRQMCERWLEVGGGSLSVAVHVGHACQQDTVALASHAMKAGAHAIAVTAPGYYKPASIQDLVEFLIPIAEAADPLPLYYYHIPVMTGVRLSPADVMHEARFRIPTLRGVKFSDEDSLELQRVITIDSGAFDVLLGCDEGLLAGFAYGVKGAVGGTYNFAAPHFERMRCAFLEGDRELARQLQWQAAMMVGHLAEVGFIAGSKAVMAMMGVDCGPPRLPIGRLSGERIAALARSLGPLPVFARPLK